MRLLRVERLWQLLLRPSQETQARQRRFAARMNPKALIPVHGVNWDGEDATFSSIQRWMERHLTFKRRRVDCV
jgi:hypothetical protein